MSKNQIYIILFNIVFWMLLFVGSPLPLCAQENDEDFQTENIRPEGKIDKEKWKKTAKSYDYSSEKEKKNKEEEEQTENDENNRKTPKREDMLSPEMQNVLKYTLFGVVIAVLVFIAFRLIAGGSIFGNKKLQKERVYTLEDIEENLENVNVEAFLNDAINMGNYRLATRLYYLNILKSLSFAGHIVWKRDKTNGMYLREMSQHPLFKDFRKSTNIYEYVWFNEEVSFEAKDFEQIRPLFRDLLEKTEKTVGSKIHETV